MPALSAGIVLCRLRTELEVLLVHPGGPFWAKKDLGAWSAPKGLVEPTEAPLAAALRELCEELGTSSAPSPPHVPLPEVRLKSGKRVQLWAAGGEFDPAQLRSNQIELEWPPRSGRRALFPEVDRAEWFPRKAALTKVNQAQVPAIEACFSEAVRGALRL